VGKPKVLVLCHDVIAERMGGAGIRYSNIARTLDSHADVTLRLMAPSVNPRALVPTISTSSDEFKVLFDATDIIFAQWLSDPMISYAREHGKIIIFDLYAPVPIEYLASAEFAPVRPTVEQDDEYNVIIDMYGRYLTYGEFFTCSNERQRDYWIGFMTVNRLLMPSNFAAQLRLDKLSLAPMGINATMPTSDNLLLRKTTPGVGPDDFVIIWTGGIWGWFDAELIIQAMAKVTSPQIKLVFLGTKHPGGLDPGIDGDTRARALAKKLGLINKTVFFSEAGWIPYETRGDYMLDADAAIYADKESLETRFSHRTRVLDTHFWAELPTICSAGDYLSDVIAKYELGIVVDERRPEAFAAAITQLYADKKLYQSMKVNLRLNRHRFTWEAALAPLVSFITSTNVSALSAKIAGSYSRPAAPPPKPRPVRRLKNSVKALLGR
jgi:glycosyltransferase involved in cell wall biosynthesis